MQVFDQIMQFIHKRNANYLTKNASHQPEKCKSSTKKNTSDQPKTMQLIDQQMEIIGPKSASHQPKKFKSPSKKCK